MVRRFLKNTGIAAITIFILVIAPFYLYAQYYNIGSLLAAVYEFSGYGGDGADGALTVNGIPNGKTNPLFTDNVRQAPTGNLSSGATSIVMGTNSGFGSGDEALVIQMLSTLTPSSVGKFEIVSVTGVSGVDTINVSALANSYTQDSASERTQVIRIPNYASVTINSGGVLTAHAWDPTPAVGTGGVMAFRSQGVINMVHFGSGEEAKITVSDLGYKAGGAGSAGEGPGGGGAGSGIGGTNMSPSGQYNKRFMAGSAGGASGTGANSGHGGGLMIIKAGGIMTMGGTLSADGRTGSNDGGGGAGGTIVIFAKKFEQDSQALGLCGSVTATGGAGAGTGTPGSNGRVMMFWEDSQTFGCTSSRPSPTSYSTYLPFHLK